MLDVKALLAKIIKTMPTLTVGSVTTSSVNIAANNVTETSISATKAGYTPLGIVGFNLNGSGVSFCAPYHILLLDGKVYYAFRNYGSGQATGVTINFYILYLKLGGGS